MMQHPFDGILDIEARDGGAADELASVRRPTRRTFLEALAAFVGLGILTRKTDAQQTLQAAPGQSSGLAPQGQGTPSQSLPPRTDFWRGPGYGGSGRYTTQALNEEGAGGRFPRERYTTYALGEEGAGYYPPRYSPPYGWDGRRRWHRGPIYTTYALGEEGGYWYP